MERGWMLAVLWLRSRPVARAAAATMVEQATETTAADALHAELRDSSIFVGQHELVSDVDPAFYASATGEGECLVLGLRTASGKATSFYDTGLGRLICNRLMGTSVACSMRLKIGTELTFSNVCSVLQATCVGKNQDILDDARVGIAGARYPSGDAIHARAHDSKWAICSAAATH